MSQNISIKGDSFFFAHCLRWLPIMELSSFFGILVQKIVVNCFSDPFDNGATSTNRCQQQCHNWYSDFLQNNRKTVFSFRQTPMTNPLWTKSTAFPTTMTICAFYTTAELTNFWWVFLNSCSRNWMRSSSHINKWTVYMQFSKIDSVAKLLSRVGKWLIVCRGQFISTNKTKEWTECLALRKKDSCGKLTRSFLEFFSTKGNQHKRVVQCLRKELNKIKRLNSN